MTESTSLRRRNNGVDLPEDFPVRLERFRDVAGLSWGELAACLGMDHERVMNWRRGVLPRDSALPNLIRLAHGYLVAWTRCSPTWWTRWALRISHWGANVRYTGRWSTPSLRTSRPGWSGSRRNPGCLGGPSPGASASAPTGFGSGAGEPFSTPLIYSSS